MAPTPRCFICVTCGVQFAPSIDPPQGCPICEDERQYVGWDGQKWTTLDELRAAHRNQIRPDLGLIGIGTEPSFAIGQRALLVQSAEGNILWDCITLIDDDTIEAVRDLGGLRAIAISHPHYYSSAVEWSHVFNAQVLLHADDQQWVMRPDRCIEFWEGNAKSLWDGMTLIRAGGHFAGGTVLHLPSDTDGRPSLLSGDILQVAQDRRRVSFMYSYPNYIPLSAPVVDRVVAAVEPFQFDRIYGAWWRRNVEAGGMEVIRRSADRYRRAISE